MLLVTADTAHNILITNWNKSIICFFSNNGISHMLILNSIQHRRATVILYTGCNRYTSTEWAKSKCLKNTYEDHQPDKLSVRPISTLASDDIPFLWCTDNNLCRINLLLAQLMITCQLINCYPIRGQTLQLNKKCILLISFVSSFQCEIFFF